MRVLLLQAREDDDPMRHAERKSFAARAGLPEDRIVPHDLLTGPPSLRKVRAHNALMVGGSGDYYVSKGDLPRFPAVLDLLREVVELGHPTFASCFGFQLIVRALGGAVVHDPERTEVGTFELRLTDDGTHDPLFGYLPATFHAQIGRKDRAEQLPPGVVNLATSERCAFHALRVPGKPIWATQFHPELDRSENQARFVYYMDGYGTYMSPDERRATLERFAESPETMELIPRFLALISGRD